MSETRPFSPLSGIRVLDLSQNIAGPYGTQILADLGADVIKVEPPGGDPARSWGPPFIAKTSPLFLAVNRNKRSVILDLKTDEGYARVRELIEGADIFVEAFRSGAAGRMGLGYNNTSPIAPGLIYVSLSAFGDEGPLANQPGYDPLLQAHSGIMDITGAPEGPASRTGTSIIDLGTGTWLALAVLAALRERDRTGTGTHVTVSLLDTSLALMSYHLTSYLETGDSPRRMGTELGSIAPYGAFPTKTGPVMIAAANDAIFSRLSEALRMGGSADFSTNKSRVKNRDRVNEAICQRTEGLSRDELMELLVAHRVPCAPVQTVSEVVDDPQVRASGMLRTVPHPQSDRYVDIPTPIRWNGTRLPLQSTPPALDDIAIGGPNVEWAPRAQNPTPSTTEIPCDP